MTPEQQKIANVEASGWKPVLTSAGGRIYSSLGNLMGTRDGISLEELPEMILPECPTPIKGESS